MSTCPDCGGEMHDEDEDGEAAARRFLNEFKLVVKMIRALPERYLHDPGFMLTVAGVALATLHRSMLINGIDPTTPSRDVFAGAKLAFDAALEIYRRSDAKREADKERALRKGSGT